MCITDRSPPAPFSALPPTTPELYFSQQVLLNHTENIKWGFTRITVNLPHYTISPISRVGHCLNFTLKVIVKKDKQWNIFKEGNMKVMYTCSVLWVMFRNVAYPVCLNDSPRDTSTHLWPSQFEGSLSFVGLKDWSSSLTVSRKPRFFCVLVYASPRPHDVNAYKMSMCAHVNCTQIVPGWVNPGTPLMPRCKPR